MAENSGFTTELVPITVDILYDGMLIDFAIYYQKDGVYKILCNDTVLSRSAIAAIKRTLDGSRNIFISRKVHKKVLEETRAFNNLQKHLETTVGYDKLTHESEKLIDFIRSSSVVPTLTVNAVVEEIDEKVKNVDFAVIMQCLNGIRNVDRYLYTHSTNVALLNGIIGKWLGLDEVEIAALVKIGLVHDIGKLKIPTEILNKPGRLTPEEFDLIKQHPILGYDMLKRSGETNMLVMRGVLQHHERMNGKGYPNAISSEEITYYARITAVSDVYDAMVARRAYKSAHSPFEVFEQFAQGRYSDLDIEIVNVFLKHMPIELLGKAVLLSDGSVGTLAFINPNSFEFPLVSIDGDIKPTNKDFFCVSMYGATEKDVE